MTCPPSERFSFTAVIRQRIVTVSPTRTAERSRKLKPKPTPGPRYVKNAATIAIIRDVTCGPEAMMPPNRDPVA